LATKLHIDVVLITTGKTLLTTGGRSLQCDPAEYSSRGKGIFMIQFFEYFGTITGILGALLLAANIRFSPWAFVIYLASCAAWIGFGLLTAAPGLVAMQTVFVCANLLGIYRWLIKPVSD